jgi:hypothetical protein
MATYEGSCFCGAVQFTVGGEPAAMGYCHCDSCRSWSAAPVNAFTLWKPEALRITRGADDIGTYNKTPKSYRKWCRKCGGHLFTEHPHWGLTDVYGDSEFPAPGRHPRQLSGNQATHARWAAEDEGPAAGNGRLG